MTKPAATEELAYLQGVWMERFGEPPAIVAEPEIMRRVLASVLAKADARSPRTERSGGPEEGAGV
jgi:hypothetical protein